jgi:hypothetical protein
MRPLQYNGAFIKNLSKELRSLLFYCGVVSLNSPGLGMKITVAGKNMDCCVLPVRPVKSAFLSNTRNIFNDDVDILFPSAYNAV